MNIYERAIKVYGRRNQKLKAIEELAELQQALCRHLIEVTDGNVEEEIADVRIMLRQLEIMFNKYEVDAWEEAKLKRLEERVEKEEGYNGKS